MVCNTCGKTISDAAIFCPGCGKRADGKIACPRCSHLNESDNTFCEKCGKRIDGKVVCTCGALLDANAKFCVKCGKGSNSVAPKHTDDCNCDVHRPKGNVLEILAVVFRHTITGLFLLSLLLFFVACFTPLLKSTEVDFEGVDKFHYYFFKGFKDYFDTDPEYRLFSSLFEVIISSVIVIANLIITLVALTIGSIKGITALVKNKESKIGKLVGLSLTSTLVLVIWFGNYAKIDTSYNVRVGTFYIIVAVLAILFLLINIGFNIGLNIKSFIKPVKITCLAINLGAVLFTLITIILLSGGVYNIADQDIKSSFLGIYAAVDIAHFATKADSPFGFEVAISLIQLFIFIGFAVVASLLLANTVTSLSEDTYKTNKQPNQLILSIITCSIVVILFVLAIILVASKDLNIKLNARIILALVFAIFTLGTHIASKIVSSVLAKKQ